jgi:TolB protein
MLSLICLSLSLWSQQVYIKLGEAQIEKSPLAIVQPKFLGSVAKNPNHVSIGNEIKEILMKDLAVMGYFTIQSSSTFLESPNHSGLRPAPNDPNGFLWEPWKSIGSEFLIRVGFDFEGPNLVLEGYGYHVTKQQFIFSNKYSGPISDMRKVVHTFADDFVYKVSGKRTFLLKKILVTATPPGSQNRELYIMDWDGHNKIQITKHQTIILSPAWSKDGKKIAYTAFMQRRTTKTRNPDLYVYDLETQTSRVISYRKGMNSGAVFESNGNLLMTISGDSNPDIYRIDATGNILKKLTDGPMGAMNVEPAISPDGKKIAFSSDRAGRPMIYVMDKDGNDPKRLTFAGTFNAAPCWSPDGKMIAFAGWAEKAFDIFTIDPTGSNLKRITKAVRSNGGQASHENPDFSPDGRAIIYTSNRTGQNQIFLSLADGSEEWRITYDNWSYYQPKWSP